MIIDTLNDPHWLVELRAGYERRQRSSRHDDVIRILWELPPNRCYTAEWVGSVCGVRGYGPPPRFISLADYEQLHRVLWRPIRRNKREH